MPVNPEFVGRLRQAQEAGLVAAAAVYENAVKAKLQDGYIPESQYSVDPGRSGVTAASVHTDPDGPQQNVEGVLQLRVGSNLAHTLFWEMGHWNIFLRKWVQVPHWQETLEEQAEAMVAAYRREFTAVMEAA